MRRGQRRTPLFLSAPPTQLLDDLEPAMAAGGNVVEFHSVDFFPERWFDIVLVLRTETRDLFDRLTARCVGRACPWPHAGSAFEVLPRASMTAARPSSRAPRSGYSSKKIEENVTAEIMQVRLRVRICDDTRCVCRRMEGV